MPAPRADTPLTPDQVKQLTDNLICEREHLTTEAQAPVPPPAEAAGAQKPASSCPQPPGAQPTVTGSTAGSTLPPSAYAKP